MTNPSVTVAVAAGAVTVAPDVLTTTVAELVRLLAEIIG